MLPHPVTVGQSCAFSFLLFIIVVVDFILAKVCPSACQLTLFCSIKLIFIPQAIKVLFHIKFWQFRDIDMIERPSGVCLSLAFNRFESVFVTGFEYFPYQNVLIKLWAISASKFINDFRILAKETIHVQFDSNVYLMYVSEKKNFFFS